jgi:transposase
MGSQRRRFSDEFKKEAVRLAYESGRQVVDVARELELRPDMLRRWRKKFFGGVSSESTSDEAFEIRRLQRELARTREERDILKKALAIFSDRPR